MKKIFSPIEEKVKKFKNIEEKKAWTKKSFRNWMNKELNMQEKDTLEKYLNPNNFAFKSKIAEYLKETGGELITENHPEIVKYNFKYDWRKLNQDIELIDSALKKTKLPETIHTFERVHESRILREMNTLRDEKGKINMDLFEAISKDFLQHDWENINYINCSMVKSKDYKTFPILFQYTLAQGINAANFHTYKFEPSNQLNIIIGRNHEVVFKQATIINETTSETLKMEFEIRLLK